MDTNPIALDIDHVRLKCKAIKDGFQLGKLTMWKRILGGHQTVLLHIRTFERMYERKWAPLQMPSNRWEGGWRTWPAELAPISEMLHRTFTRSLVVPSKASYI